MAGATRADDLDAVATRITGTIEADGEVDEGPDMAGRDAAELVRRTCEHQGLPERVTDAASIAACRCPPPAQWLRTLGV